MRGEGFWKRIVILCLTFWLGVFLTDSTLTKKAPPKPLIVAENLKCFPADPKLKYQLLKEDESSVEEINKTAEQVKAEIEENQKSNEEKDKVLYRPSKDFFEYQTLLHKENCYESK